MLTFNVCVQDVGEVSKQSIETAWFTKRNIQGSVKKLNLMARQVKK